MLEQEHIDVIALDNDPERWRSGSRRREGVSATRHGYETLVAQVARASALVIPSRIRSLRCVSCITCARSILLCR